MISRTINKIGPVPVRHALPHMKARNTGSEPTKTEDRRGGWDIGGTLTEARAAMFAGKDIFPAHPP
jgi:hypothetical protein